MQNIPYSGSMTFYFLQLSCCMLTFVRVCKLSVTDTIIQALTSPRHGWGLRAHCTNSGRQQQVLRTRTSKVGFHKEHAQCSRLNTVSAHAYLKADEREIEVRLVSWRCALTYGEIALWTQWHAGKPRDPASTTLWLKTDARSSFFCVWQKSSKLFPKKSTSFKT